MSPATKTLLLLETRMTGHRPSYLRRITQMALRNGMQVLIAMPKDCLEHPVAQTLLNTDNKTNNRTTVNAIHCQREVDNTQSSNISGMLRRERQCAAFYKEALYNANKIRPVDIIIIGTFDDAGLSSGLRLPAFGDTPWLGIVMKQRFHFSAADAIGPPGSKLLLLKRWLFVRLLKQLKPQSQILTIDESLHHFMASNYPAVKNRIAYIPDPVDDRREVTRPEVRIELAIPKEAFVILAYGSLRKRKGVESLLDVLHELPDNIHALLVGTQTPDIKACVNSEKHSPLLAAGRVHQMNRYIDVSEDPNFFSPADAIWLAYQDYFAMSAVMVQAAQYRRPAIASKNGLVGFLTNKYQTGLLVDTTDKSQLHVAITKLMNNDFCPTEEHYDAFSSAFSLAAFEGILLDSIEHVCSASPTRQQ